jgi:hypothetical protein
MQGRIRGGRIVVAAALVALAAASAAAQAVPGAALPGGWTMPRTLWGDPDLQGIWPSTHMVGVPFERPDQFGTRLFLTDEELKARQAQADRQAELDRSDFDIEAPSAEIEAMGDVGGPTSPPPFWLERGEPSRQSSLIVDPPDGKMPPMTPEGQERAKNTTNTYVQYTGFEKFDDLGPYDRCISRGVLGSMFPVVYNNGNQILQIPGYVVVRNEMIHEVRVIPLDGRPHLSPAIRSYMGDSRGRWEGDTLVVETTNLNGRTGAQANGNLQIMSESLTLVERFTRTGSDTLLYEVTVNDPGTWTRPWKVAYPLRRDPDYRIFEYACHEGNYAMSNILSGSRADERGGR